LLVSFIVLSVNKLKGGGEMADDNRGFASMPQDEVEDIARKGGKTTGASNLTDEDRARGGENSHGGGRPQGS
jgi:general stress protein YciG